MKKYLFIFTLIFLLAGCSKEDIITPEETANGQQLTVNVPVTTKVAFNYEGGSIDVVWQLEDAIDIYNHNGILVGTFKATTLNNGGRSAIFENIDPNGELLTQGTRYTAMYPSTGANNITWREDVTSIPIQDGNNLEHLDDHCVMRDDFIFGESVKFEHQKAIIIAKMKMPDGAAAPTTFEFKNGDHATYTVNLTNAIADATGLYTIIFMINPDNGGVKNLVFTLSNGTETNSKLVQSTVQYNAGWYYTADLSTVIEKNIIFTNGKLKAALLGRNVDSNSDNEISYNEAESVKVLDLSNLDLGNSEPTTRALTRNVDASTSVDELSYFTGLEELNLSGNQLTDLDVPLSEQLTSLDVSNNNLGILDVSALPNLGAGGLVCGNQQSDNGEGETQEITVVMSSEQESTGLVDTSNPNNVGTATLNPDGAITFSNEMLQMVLIWSGSVDINYDGQITLEEARAAEILILSELPDVPITDSDMKFFPNIKEFQVSGVTVLDLSRLTKLEKINITYSVFTKLDISKNTNLKEAVFYNCDFSQVEMSQLTKFTKLYLDAYMGISSWDFINRNITDLQISPDYSIYQHGYPSIDVSHLTNLTYLSISFHDLANLNLSANTKLNRLYIMSCIGDSINLSNNASIENIILKENLELSKIVFPTNSKLKEIEMERNNFTSIDFSGIVDLEELNLYNERNLTTITLDTHPKLSSIDIGTNKVDSLDISNLAALTYLNCSSSSGSRYFNLLLTKAQYNDIIDKKITLSKNRTTVNYKYTD